MQKVFSFITFLILGIATYTCQLEIRHRLVIDVDTGNDDGTALMVLLNADQEKRIKIEAVVCTYGNTIRINTCNNTIRILRTAGRYDIPVYPGAEKPLITPYNKPTWDGNDGFGDLKYNSYAHFPKFVPSYSLALRRLVQRYPKQISLMILSPPTSIALCLATYNEIAEYIQEFYIIGGNYDPDHSVTLPPDQQTEFNLAIDPEASYMLFTYGDYPITLFPFETAIKTNITSKWRFEVLGKIENPVCDLLKYADLQTIGKTDKVSSKYWRVFDAMLAMLFLHPEKANYDHVNAAIDLVPSQWKGQLLIQNATVKQSNAYRPVKIATKVDYQALKQLLLHSCENVCKRNACRNIYNAKLPDTPKIL